MKKLMMAVAIVCAAAFTQAASIDWSVAQGSWTLSDGSTKPASGTLVYLINGDTALDTIAKAVADGNITEQTWYFGSAATDNTKGRISETTAVSGNLTRGTEYAFSALMVDGTKYMVSATTAQNAYDPAQKDDPLSVSFTSDLLGANSQTASAAGAVNGWATASVPEPTSGLLLLLGVAGMALRRRRA